MFYLLTPDGFTLTHEAKLYSCNADAYKDYLEWKSQYKNQGYYSSTYFGKIKLDKLWEYMLKHDKPFIIL